MKPNYKLTLNCCYMAYIVQAISINFVPLLFVIFQTQYGMSLQQLSALILVTFTAQLSADIFSIKVLDWLSYRGTIIISMTLSILGLVGLGFLPQITNSHYPYLMSCCVMLALGGGLMEAALSPLADDLQVGDKKSSMAILHSFYCWGFLLVVIISTIFLRFAGYANWFYLPFIWAVVPLTTLTFFTFIPISKPLERKERTSIKQLVLSPIFALCFLVMICSGASEMIITQWASLFAEKGLGVSKVLGDLFGPATFALLMGIGRLFYGNFGSKINLNKVLLIGSIGTVMCYLGASLVPNAIVALVFCGLSGIFICMLWPGTFAASSSLFPKGSYFLFSLLAFSGDIGCSIGPSFAGAIADKFSTTALAEQIAQSFSMTSEQVGLRIGILAGTVFPILLVICVLLLNRATKKVQQRACLLLNADLSDN